MKKGILIDTKNRMIREVEIESKNGSELDSIYKHLECDLVDVVHHMGHDVYVDDEGLFKITDDSTFFLLEGYPQPLHGNGLMLGLNRETGESVSCKLNVEDVSETVRFLTLDEVRNLV